VIVLPIPPELRKRADDPTATLYEDLNVEAAFRHARSRRAKIARDLAMWWKPQRYAKTEMFYSFCVFGTKHPRFVKDGRLNPLQQEHLERMFEKGLGIRTSP
jgi:hypothetical protein